MNPPAPMALAGVRLIEMGQLIAGPFAGKTLGEFGADVVKIEAPGAGDPLRNWRLIKNGTSVWWQVQSRNKRSVAIDLRQPEGQDLARQLIADGQDRGRPQHLLPEAVSRHVHLAQGRHRANRGQPAGAVQEERLSQHEAHLGLPRRQPRAHGVPRLLPCHDDLHKSADGKVIRQDCELCHDLIE